MRRSTNGPCACTRTTMAILLSRNTSRVPLLWPLLLPRSVTGSTQCFQRGYSVCVLSRLVPYFIFPTCSSFIYHLSGFLSGFLSLTLHLLALPPHRQVQHPHKHLGSTHAIHGKASHALTCIFHICACQLWLTYHLSSRFQQRLEFTIASPPVTDFGTSNLNTFEHCYMPTVLYYLSTTADRTRQIAKHIKHTLCQQPPAQHLRTGPCPDEPCIYSGCVIYILQFSFALHTIC